MNNWMKSLTNIGLPQSFHITYIVEILILTVIIYELLIWVKNTRAWTLLKGIVVVTVFALGSYFFHLTTLTWIMSKTVYEMGKVKTGALIVMEKQVILNEYERTGIPIDAQISSQLLMNIFEHNTPLHDGAVFIRNQRIVAATCYLPLSDNMELSKELGTRHRAGVGISEVSDSLTIIVSEETGAVSIAEGGLLKRDVGQDELKKKLSEITQGIEEGKRKKLMGRIKNERKTDA